MITSVQQATNIDPDLSRINPVWDRLQTTAFFVQETSLNILYIWQTRKFLGRTRLLRGTMHGSASQDTTERISLLYQLIYINLFIIALDIALLGIQYADLFYLQGAFKPCVYGIKLKMEFVILNRLVDSLQARGGQRAYRSTSSGLGTSGNDSTDSGKRGWWLRLVKATSKTDRGETRAPENVALEHLGRDQVRRLESQGSRDPIVRRLGAEASGFVEGHSLPPVHWQQ